jgi:phosphopantetheinyl transferase
MTLRHAREVEVWTARPTDFKDAQWPALNAWLDGNERRRAGAFRMQADCRAYVLAHAMRRLAVAKALAVPCSHVSFSNEANGNPILTAPREAALYFSHAHHRDLAVCAVTRAAPVGIDVEFLRRDYADLALLSGFVKLPDAQRREAELGDASRQFFFYWTVLEAYWKSRGCGLSSGNPPIRCEQTGPGLFQVSLVTAEAPRPCALALPLQSPPDCMIMLVLAQTQAGGGSEQVTIHYRKPAFFHADGRAILQPEAT